jgi:hypothetical protein
MSKFFIAIYLSNINIFDFFVSKAVAQTSQPAQNVMISGDHKVLFAMIVLTVITIVCLWAVFSKKISEKGAETANDVLKMLLGFLIGLVTGKA